MKQLYNFSNDCFKDLDKKLNDYKRSSKPETLHKIRVDLKKIRTVFYLLEYCSDDFDAAGEFKKLKKIFRKAGRIREVDILVQLLKEYKIRSQVQDPIKKAKHKKNISEFIKDVSVYKRSVHKHQEKIRYLTKKVKPACLKQYLDHEEKDARKKLRLNPDQKELHEIRKHIKTILYLHSVLGDRSKKIENYNNLQELIGERNDKFMILVLTKKKSVILSSNAAQKLKTEIKNDLSKIKSLTRKICKV